MDQPPAINVIKTIVVTPQENPTNISVNLTQEYFWKD